MHSWAKIKKWINEHKLKNAHLAELIGVSKQMISQVLSGSKKPSPKILSGFARLHGQVTEVELAEDWPKLIDKTKVYVSRQEKRFAELLERFDSLMDRVERAIDRQEALQPYDEEDLI